MKQILRLFAVLVAVGLCCPWAQAVVDPYEALTVTPAEGTVESLQHFTITFADLPVKVTPGSVPTLEKGGGATLEGTMRADDEGKTVIIDFDECCTASGHYFLTIPEGSLVVNNQRLLPLTLRFEIPGTTESFYEQITVDPAEGVVESLQNFTISLPEYVGEIEYGKRATLTNTTTGKTWYGEMYDVSYKVLLYFPQEVFEAGEYTLTIPEGAIVIYTMEDPVHELNFHYTIEAGNVEQFYEEITIDPTEGFEEILQRFTITFPKNVDGIAEGSLATLANTTKGQTWQAGISAEGNQVTIDFGEQIELSGRYTLTIPAGAVIVNALGEEMRELKFEYTITGGGMPDYTINPPEGELYILQYFTIAYGERVEVLESVHPILSNDETGEEFRCNLIEIGGNAVVYLEYPTSEIGNYTLTIPSTCIMIESTGQVNPEMTFHYTIVEKETFVPTVIDAQPDGDLKLYMRSGMLVREVEKEQAEEGEYPYELIYEQQEGMLSFVFADSNKVYIQRPVSWTYYDGWVEGTLSEDGKTITVPMGQYIAYTKSLEMAIQVAMFAYDEEKNSYFYDPSVEEVTYTIHDDGSISLNGTDVNLVMGTMNRAFGQNFQYLDYEWLQAGDYGSAYLPIDEAPLTPPADLEMETYYMTTATNDGYAWDPYRATVNVGFEGENVWIQGISEYLPKAWIKGEINGSKITFHNPQLLGSNDVLFYFKCADYNPVDGSTTQKDMELTVNRMGDMTTFDYIFITVDKDHLYFINYYQGLTLSRYPDVLLEAPEDLELKDYEFSYRTQYGPNHPAVADSHTVHVGFLDDLVYIQGIWPGLPEAWVAGELKNGKIEMNLPQYMGRYVEEYAGTYPIYLGTFDKTNGSVLPQVIFDYNAVTGVFSNMTSPFSIGINKTGYLSVQDYTDLVFTPENSSVEDVKADTAGVVEYYDLQGHKLNDISNASGIFIVRNPDGTVTKVLKR